MEVSRLTLATLLDTTPTSSAFRDLVASSRMYGLTNGGINAEEFSLTDVGGKATSEDDGDRDAGLKAAVLSVPPYKTFFDAFKGKKVPSAGPMREFLGREAGVPAEYIEDSMTSILEDAQTAGLVRSVKGSDWVDFTAAAVTPTPEDDVSLLDDEASDEDDAIEIKRPRDMIPETPSEPAKKKRPNRLFIGHGKNKKPLDQLTKMLRDLGIPHLVAEEEANVGRPISKKVRDTMDQCGAAILIFSADVEYFDKDQNSVWRPSENVAHELGASAVMYDDRIIIFKESSVTLASNFSGLVYISFEKDNLEAKMNELLRELVALKILRLSVDDD
jgi:predicted nucleotide-binding protein